MLYLALCFTFLALSITLQMLNSLVWLPWIYQTRLALTLYELSGLAFFACFAITAIIALRKTTKA